MVDTMWENIRRFLGKNPRYELVGPGGIVELLLPQNEIDESGLVAIGKPVNLEKAISLKNLAFRTARNRSFFDKFYLGIMLKDAADTVSIDVAPFIDAAVVSPFSYRKNPFRNRNKSSFIAYPLGVQFLSKGFEGSSSFLEGGTFSNDITYGFDIEDGILFNSKVDPFGEKVEVRIYEAESNFDEKSGLIKGKKHWDNPEVQDLFNERLGEIVREDSEKLSKSYGDIVGVKLSPMKPGKNYYNSRIGERGFCVAVSYLF